MHLRAQIAALYIFPFVYFAQAQWTALSEPSPRYGQASTRISNYWFIHGGKLDTPGFTFNSAPNCPEVLALDLTSKEWYSQNDTAAVAFHTISSSSTSALLVYGGRGDTLLPAAADSSYLCSVQEPSVSGAQLNCSHEAAGWANQPSRRIYHTATRKADLTYIFGGLKDDGSMIAYNELWAYATTQQWTQIVMGGGPSTRYGHTVTLLPDGLAVLGGLESSNTLADMASLYLFQPDSTGLTGTWQLINVSGDSPAKRHGHVAVALNSSAILIHGGASADNSQVYSDMAILTLSGSTASWSISPQGSNAPSARFGHAALFYNDQLLVMFGYGRSSSADGDLHVFNVADNSWTFTFSSNTPNNLPPGSLSTAPAPLYHSTGSTTLSSGPNHDSSESAPSQSHSSSVGAGSSSPKPKVVAAVVSVIAIGALVASAATILIRRHRTSSQYFTKGAGRFGDGADGLLPGSTDTAFLEKAKPMQNLGNSPVKQALQGLLGYGNRTSRQRFDMLADEESDVWHSRDPSQSSSRRSGSLGGTPDWKRRKISRGWVDAPLESQVNEKTALAVESDRVGYRIWNRSETSSVGLSSSKSFMSHALGPLLTNEDSKDLASLADDISPPSTPRPTGPRPMQLYDPPSSSTIQSLANESDTTHSSTSLPIFSSPHSIAPKVSPDIAFSPSASLNGSFSPVVGQNFSAPKRTASWFARVKGGPSKPAMIRDVVEMPPSIEEDPFGDEHSQQSVYKDPFADRQQPSHVTDSSSLLEHQMQGYQVMQRIRTVSDGSILEQDISTSPSETDLTGLSEPYSWANVPAAESTRKRQSSGVRAMVEQIELRSSNNVDPVRRTSRVQHDVIQQPKLFVVN